MMSCSVYEKFLIKVPKRGAREGFDDLDFKCLALDSALASN